MCKLSIICLLLSLSLSFAYGQQKLSNVKLSNVRVGAGSGGGADTAFITSVTLTSSERSDVTGCLGFKLTTPGSSPPVITSLGRYSNPTTPNTLTHVVRLTDCATAEFANVTVNMNGTTPNTFVYGAITPYTTAINTTYCIASDETNGGDRWADDSAITINSTNSVAGTIGFSVYNVTGPCPATLSNNTASKTYIPVNFLFH